MRTQRIVLAMTACLFAAAACPAPGQSLLDVVDTEGGTAIQAQRWLQPRPVEGPSYAARLAAFFIDCNSPPEGDNPRELAFTPDGLSVAIVNHGTGLLPGTMTFYDVNSRTITHTVTVGLLPNHVAVTPNGQYAVCTNVFSNSVSIVDIPTHTLVANVPVTGTQPFRVAITPDSLSAVVAVTNDGVNSRFSVIDLASRTEVRSFSSVGQGAIGGFFTPEVGLSSPLWSVFALSPDGTTIVLPNRTGARVMLYDVATGGVVASLASPASPASVDISADGTVAVVGHEFGARQVSRIDMVARTLSSVAIADDIGGTIIRITPDKNFAIAGSLNNTSFYSLATGATTGTIFTGSVGDIEISFDGQYAFVSNFNSSVINIATQSLAASVTLAACAEAACSPTQLKAVALNDRFREDIHLYNINGASSSALGLTLTGEPPEGDCIRSVALSGDGRTLVTGNTTSRNVTIIDAATSTVLGYVDTGDRVLDLAVTPDGHYAVVCNTDDSTVSIVDVPLRTRVAQLSCPTRPAKVKISPDGTKAYVLSVAGTDMIHFININGAASSVIGTVIAGQTGSAQGYAYTDVSGIQLSPDGSILAVCVSFDDNIRLINTATRAVIADVPVGIDASMEFPMRCAFSPSGNRLFVTMAFGDALAVVNINGASSSRIATIGGMDFPLTVDVDPLGQFVYVGTSGNQPGVYVVNAASNAVAGAVPLGGTVRGAAISSGVLYAAGLNSATGGKLWRVAATGSTASLLDETPLSGSPSELAYSSSLRTVYMPQPVPDGVDRVYVGPTCGTADFDGDGDSGTDADIEAFFACLAGNCCATCFPLGADFNGDGDSGTDADIEAFFRVLAGGNC